MYLHISEMKFLRGKFRIWLPHKSSWDAVLLLLPTLSPSFLCLKIPWLCSHTFPVAKILPLKVCIYLPETLPDLCRLVYSLSWFNSHESTPWTCLSHAGANRQAISGHYNVPSILVWSLFYDSVVPLTHTLLNNHLFLWIVCIFNCYGFIYLPSCF